MTTNEANRFPGLRIVLVETSHPGNIGAAARAMKNIGITRLVLINPKEFPSNEARYRSASAVDVIEEAVVVPDVQTAIADCSLVIGTSARDRRIPWPMLDPKGCGVQVNQHLSGEGAGEAAILFGREDRGLKNEELQQCQYHVNIPTGEAYSSLNLAMAVQVICYEVLQAQLGEFPAPERDWDMEFAKSSEVEHFMGHLEETLVQVGFHDPENPRQLMTRLRRLFSRIRPDQMEINILRGFLSAVNKKVPDSNPSKDG